MKYYLVAMFDTDSYKKIERIQRDFSRKFRSFNDLPILHVEIDTVGDPDIDKLSEIITGVLKPYKKFKVRVKSNINVNTAKRFANIEVDREGYISRISRKINQKLVAGGFNVCDMSTITDENNLIIPIASSNRAIRDMSQADLSHVSFGNTDSNMNMAKIDRVELWKITGVRSRTIIKSFPLREY